MNDDLQWQQEQQRMAHQRVQEQLEQQRQERLEIERLEREQLEEDGRLEREERARLRQEEARNEDRGSAVEREHGEEEEEPSRGFFSFFRRRDKADEQLDLEPDPAILSAAAAHTAAAPVVPPMAMPGVMPEIRGDASDSSQPEAKKSPGKTVTWLVFLAIAGLAFMWFYTSNNAPTLMPAGLEDDNRNAALLSVPALTVPDPDASVGAVDAGDTAALESPAHQESDAGEAAEPTADAAPQMTAVETQPPEALPATAEDAAVEAAAVTDPEPATAASEQAAKADAEPAQVALDQRLDRLEAAVEEIRQLLLQRAAAAAQPARRPARAAPRAPAAPVQAAAPAAPSKHTPRLLSVDMWDGKPSVVVSTGDPADTRTRVMQPGDSINGITLREANVQSRSASFDVGSGRLVRMSVEDQ